MANNRILGICNLNTIHLIIIIISFCCCFDHHHCSSYGSSPRGGSSNSITVSSFSYSKTVIAPYSWRYIRVVLPTSFSSMSVSLESDVDLNVKSSIKSKLPMICLREGSPPLPDSHSTPSIGLVLHSISNGSLGSIQGINNEELCYAMQKNFSVQLTNEQISPGVWYWGLFNGIGTTRTQSKMINRGDAYSFNGNISVEGCAVPTLWGPYCNQTVNTLSCNIGNNTANNVSVSLSCRNPDGIPCHEDSEPKYYSLDIRGTIEQLNLKATNVTGSGSEITLTCYARLGAMPTLSLFDYSANITDQPLVIGSPAEGLWYFAIYSVNLLKVCYSLDTLLHQCPEAKAGLNCTWERYMLQTILRNDPNGHFQSYYIPTSNTSLSDSANFPLETLLSNSSHGDFAWTYLIFDIPYEATGANLHIRLNSEKQINYGIYVKHGGIPSLDSWDYYYANVTSNSNKSMSFKLYDSSDKSVSFYVLYARTGTWGLGIKHLNMKGGSLRGQTTMSISLERCPKRCYSPHGTCKTATDASGLSLYSYCDCDRNHGGFDCSIEIVSHRGHMWQSIFLIASNAAAVLPAYWSLRHKAFAEWVLFMSSGISSGIYHACDTGTWCVLSFAVLQFLDFWLSFMAVVSTFVYIVDISEDLKRAIHTVVAIVTALLAITAPTRSTNIGAVIAIGAAGLLLGWLIEFCTRHRTLSLPISLSVNIYERCGSIKEWFLTFVKALVKRFRWWFLLAAFTALAMAAISWTMESTQSYWIWHSFWHISIYTSSFLFLCSKAKKVVCENTTLPHRDYVLTRQDSSSRR